MISQPRLITISRLAKQADVCLAADIHNNDVRADLFNIFIGNTYIRFTAEKIRELTAVVYENLADMSAALVKFQIRDSSQFFTVPHINHIFAFEFRKEHILNLSFSHYSLFYAGMAKGFKSMNIFQPICE